MAKKPLVGIVMGSDTDLPVMAETAGTLKKFQIPFEIEITSAHRSPARTSEYARTAVERGLKAIIVGAGGASHLAGVIAAETILPVIGVPMATTTLGGARCLVVHGSDAREACRWPARRSASPARLTPPSSPRKSSPPLTPPPRKNWLNIRNNWRARWPRNRRSSSASSKCSAHPPRWGRLNYTSAPLRERAEIILVLAGCHVSPGASKRRGSAHRFALCLVALHSSLITCH